MFEKSNIYGMGTRPKPRPDREEIAQRLDAGESYKNLMKEKGLSKTRIYDIWHQVKHGFGRKREPASK